MPNPILNDRRLQQASQASAASDTASGWGAATVSHAPVDDGPISSWNSQVMTVRGTASATGVLFLLLLVSAVFGWAAATAPGTDAFGNDVYKFPSLAMVGVLVGFACVIGLMFKPMWARFLGPIYAIAEGFFLGAISRGYETYYDGIVVQAAGATIAVFGVMLFLYGTRIVKVTDRMRRIVVGATVGVMVFYGVAMLMRLFGGSVSFLTSPSLFGIGFSLFVAGLAAFNLALDFDFIERGAQQRLPKNVEWVAAFGLLVTVVWLYLEILRLLAKLRDR